MNSTYLKSGKILVGGLAILGMTFVGLVVASLVLGKGPFTMIGVIVGLIVDLTK